MLDRTKEPGCIGEPLYLDVITALTEGFSAGNAPLASFPKVIGGRYGLSSKEFTPAMVASVFEELTKPAPLNHFTIGINDDVTQTSLDYDPEFSTEDPDHDARHVLRTGRRWNGRREQEHHQDHRRRYRRFTCRATSSTTRRSRAQSRPRTCASARSRFARPISSRAPTLSPAISSASWSGSMC